MRRAWLVIFLVLAAQALAQNKVDNYLLIDSGEIEAAKQKATKHAWAERALQRLVADAERAISRPLEIPERGGQWPHWYSCKRDGVKLTTVSPTEHKCPLCGAVYHGDPYDAVVLHGVHSRNSSAVRDCGLAYRFTGRAEFARRAGEILKAYADRYASYPLHDKDGNAKVGGGHILSQTLDESVWLIPVAWGYALVRDTLTASDRTHIEKDLLVAAANVIRAHKMSVHNIQCWKNSAVGVAGYAAGREDLVREAIDDAERGFRVQIARGVTDDGLWYEGSLGYHSYTMSALWPLAEAARHAGVNLYDERYRTLWDAPLALALPDGNAPGFNDNGGGNVLRLAPLYELANSRWKSRAYAHLVAKSGRDSLEALLYGTPQVETGAMIPETSSLLKDAGFATLRGGTSAVAMRFGRHGGGHGHPDKLNIVTYGGDATLGIDPGSINYGVPLHREWYRTTIAHNTVSVDSKPQASVDGKLEKWSVENSVTTIVASANAVYPGVQLKRSVSVTAKGVVEDRFECASEAEHVYDWAFHAAGALSSSLTFVARKAPLGEANGYQHIADTAVAETNEPFWVKWRQGQTTLTLQFQGQPGTTVIRGVAPGKDPAEKVPMIIVRRKASKTVFEARHSVN